jgi:hypothetical protein
LNVEGLFHARVDDVSDCQRFLVIQRLFHARVDDVPFVIQTRTGTLAVPRVKQ